MAQASYTNNETTRLSPDVYKLLILNFFSSADPTSFNRPMDEIIEKLCTIDPAFREEWPYIKRSWKEEIVTMLGNKALELSQEAQLIIKILLISGDLEPQLFANLNIHDQIKDHILQTILSPNMMKLYDIGFAPEMLVGLEGAIIFALDTHAPTLIEQGFTHGQILGLEYGVIFALGNHAPILIEQGFAPEMLVGLDGAIIFALGNHAPTLIEQGFTHGQILGLEYGVIFALGNHAPTLIEQGFTHGQILGLDSNSIIKLAQNLTQPQDEVAPAAAHAAFDYAACTEAEASPADNTPFSVAAASAGTAHEDATDDTISAMGTLRFTEDSPQ